MKCVNISLDLHSSMNQYFPDDQCMMLQIHEEVKNNIQSAW